MQGECVSLHGGSATWPRYHVRNVQPLSCVMQHYSTLPAQHERHVCIVVDDNDDKADCRRARHARSLVALSSQLPRLLRDEAAARHAIEWQQWCEALRTLPASCHVAMHLVADNNNDNNDSNNNNNMYEAAERDVCAHPAYAPAVFVVATLEQLQRRELCDEEQTRFAHELVAPFVYGRRLLGVDWAPLQRMLRRWLHCRRARAARHARARAQLQAREAAARAALCTHICTSTLCWQQEQQHTGKQRTDDDGGGVVDVYRDYCHALLRACAADEAAQRGALLQLQLRTCAAAAYAWLRLGEQCARTACIFADTHVASRPGSYARRLSSLSLRGRVLAWLTACEQHARHRVVADEQGEWQAHTAPAVVRRVRLVDVDEGVARVRVVAAEATARAALTLRLFALRVHYTLRDVQACEAVQWQQLQRLLQQRPCQQLMFDKDDGDGGSDGNHTRVRLLRVCTHAPSCMHTCT